MTSRSRIAFALSVALLAMLASPAWAQKNSAVASFSAPFTGDDTITATIDKGKKKRLLVANASAVIQDGIGISIYCDMSLTLTANGVDMLTPVGGRHARTTCECTGGGCASCSLSAVAYLDLDLAEEANPGLFVKQPIDVQLRISAGGAPACTGGDDDAATLVAQMIKK